VATCVECGEENLERARFCLACGTPLAAGPAPDEERKVVSILFVDLVGFTAMSERIDPEDVRARLRPYHARSKQEIERFGGTVEKFIGDAVMAAFGAPVAAQCRLDEQQLAALDVALAAGPLAAGWEDQRWTLARVRDLVAAKFKVAYTIPGIWYLLQRRGWTCQLGARRAIERDDGAVEVWKKETWPRIKARRRPSAAGSSSKTSAASR
jgi:hypothetical protein